MGNRLPAVVVCCLSILFASAAHAQEHWGSFQSDSCTGMGTRQFSAILLGIPWGTSWEAACAKMPADINGHHFNAPSRCKNKTTNMWGEFDVPDNSCRPSWGAFKKDQCTDIGKRQYSAVLQNIPPNVPWETACIQTRATVAGQSFERPVRCKNTGLAMWGEFDVADATCRPLWGAFKRDACTGEGKRQYSSVLQNIAPGISWELACSRAPADVAGTHFAAPTRCKNVAGTAMWGEFDVPDSACRVSWGPFKKDACFRKGFRQYSSVLQNIPPGISWEVTCSRTPADVAGTHFAAPTRCKNVAGTAMWGEFDVPDNSCVATWSWGKFDRGRCTDSGKRQYSAKLEHIPFGMPWEDACASMSAEILGQKLYKPARCKKDALSTFISGEFEVAGDGCSPTTECSDPRPPAGSFPKPGNDGSVSCDAYCANSFKVVGQAGACAKGTVVAGLHAGSCIRCVDVGRETGDTNITCHCNPLLPGFADLHNHQFANLAFGGLAVWGKPFGKIEEALPWCTPAHGPGGVNDPLFDTLRRKGAVASLNPLAHGHLVGGFPQFDGWPRFTSTSHQSVYEDWLYRAYQGGLRLMVMLAVNNEQSCNTPLFNKAPGRTCADAEAIRLQIDGPEGAKAMERYIDQKSGGPGRGWYRIVYSPQQAREAIRAGKLAVVLGAEVDNFLDCPIDRPCTTDQVRTRLDEYYRMGLRHVFPIHFIANAFGGAALSNPITFGPSRFCDREGYEYQRDILKAPICSSMGLTDLGKFLLEELMKRKMIFDVDHMSVLARADAFKIARQYGYPVISGHTGFLDTAKGASRNEGNLKPEEVEEIRSLGGMVSVIASPGEELDEVQTWRRGRGQPVIEHQCGRTSQSFAQTYLYAVDKMGGMAVGIGTDFNAGPLQPGPRFDTRSLLQRQADAGVSSVGGAVSAGGVGGLVGGAVGGPVGGAVGGLVGGAVGGKSGGEVSQAESACPGGQVANAEQTVFVRYPFPVSVVGSPARLDRSVVGRKTFDINTDGLAHMGMLPDFFEDLKQQGLRPEDLAPLFRSAEAYIQMWEKIERSNVR